MFAPNSDAEVMLRPNSRICSGDRMKYAAMKEASMTSASAGTMRRARRARKFGKENAFRAISLCSSEVIRKPEMTKKISTPTKPPGTCEGAA